MSNLWKYRRGATARTNPKSLFSAHTKSSEVLHSRDEELAAFLDGRLDERERSEMIGHLADEEDAYEIFACTAAMLLDGDALLAKMQTPEVRAASRRAFDASPDELRKAAIAAAHTSER